MGNTVSRSRTPRSWIWLSAILLLVIALLTALIWGMDRENKRARRELQLNSLLTQSYYELVDYVDLKRRKGFCYIFIYDGRQQMPVDGIQGFEQLSEFK